MKRQLVVEDVVQILLHEGHGVGEAVLLVVSAVVHVGVVTEDGIGDVRKHEPQTLQPRESRGSLFAQTKPKGTNSLMVMQVGISVQSRANLTGVTSSWGSRSTWAWSMRRQKEARRSKGSVSSIMHRKMRSMSSCLEISSMAKYWRSRHMRAKSFSWYLEQREKTTLRLLPASD